MNKKEEDLIGKDVNLLDILNDGKFIKEEIKDHNRDDYKISIREFIKEDGITSTHVTVAGEKYTHLQFIYFLKFLASGYFMYPADLKEEVRDADDKPTGEFKSVKGFVIYDHFFKQYEMIEGTAMFLSKDYKKLYKDHRYDMPIKFRKTWEKVINKETIAHINTLLTFKPKGVSKFADYSYINILNLLSYDLEITFNPTALNIRQNTIRAINRILTMFADDFICKNCGEITAMLKFVNYENKDGKTGTIDICRNCTIAAFNRTRLTSNKVGRNEPCPCGSGKKYKKCCHGKEEV